MKELLKIGLVRGDNDRLYIEVWEALEIAEDGSRGSYRQIEHVPVSDDSLLHKSIVEGERA